MPNPLWRIRSLNGLSFLLDFVEKLCANSCVSHQALWLRSCRCRQLSGVVGRKSYSKNRIFRPAGKTDQLGDRKKKELIAAVIIGSVMSIFCWRRVVVDDIKSWRDLRPVCAMLNWLFMVWRWCATRSADSCRGGISRLFRNIRTGRLWLGLELVVLLLSSDCKTFKY